MEQGGRVNADWANLDNFRRELGQLGNVDTKALVAWACRVTRQLIQGNAPGLTLYSNVKTPSTTKAAT